MKTVIDYNNSSAMCDSVQPTVSNLQQSWIDNNSLIEIVSFLRLYLYPNNSWCKQLNQEISFFDYLLHLYNVPFFAFFYYHTVRTSYDNFQESRTSFHHI
jgi:hypothetical protein